MAYDGSIIIDTRIDSNGFNKGVNTIGSGVNRLKSSLLKLGAAVGIAFGIKAVVEFGKASVQASSEAANALMGLQSIIEGQGRSYSKAKKFLEEYIKDGLIPATEAATAYKNLAARGYSDDQIQQTLTALKDSAAYGRQSSLSLGQAVSSATEGLKNENSILVDNAGVTKNVAKMWDDYAKSIGTTAGNLTQAQKIQAEVNGILYETRFQTGDAAKVAGSYSGQVLKLGYNFNLLKVAVGNAIIPVLSAILPYVNAAIQGLTALANTFAGVVSLLFGKEVKQQNAVASSASAAAGAQDDLAASTGNVGNATKKASKQVDKYIASFDTLERITSNASDNSSGVADAISSAGSGFTVGDSKDMLVGDNIKLSPKVQAAAEALKEFLEKLGKAFEPTKKALLDYFNVWQNTVGKFIWTGLKDFYHEFLVPVGKWTLGKGIPDLINATSVHLQKTDWNRINGALKEFWKALAPLSIKVGEGLVWFYANALVPLATWTMNNVVPLFLEILTNAIKILSAVIDALKPVFLWFWNNVLVPVAKWTGGVIVAVLKALRDVLGDIADWISHNQGLFAAMTITVGLFFAAWKVTQLMAFIGMGGGVAGAFGKITKAIQAVTIAKIQDKIVTLQLTGLYAKDFLASIVKSGAGLKGLGAGLKTAAAGFKSFMAGLPLIVKFGVSLAGLAATFVVVQTAVKKFALGGTDLKKMLITIIPVIAAVGVAMYAMWGPIGLVLVAVTALIAALVGYNQAQDELIDKRIDETFFNGMGVGLDTIKEKLIDTTSEMSRTSQYINELGATIDTNNKAISDAQIELGNYELILSSTGTLTQEQAEKMKESYDSLINNMRQNLQIETDIILTAFNSSSKKAAEKLGVNVEEMTQILIGFQAKFDEELNGEKAKVQPLLDKLLKENTLTDEEMRTLQESMERITDLSETVSQSQVKLERQIENTTKIDFGEDIESAKKSVSELAEVAEEYRGELSNARDEEIAALESIKLKMSKTGDLTPELEKMFDGWQESIDLSYSENIQAINDKMADVGKKLTDAINQGIVDGAKDAPLKWQDAVAAFFGIGSKDGFRQGYIEEKLKPLQDEISNLFTDIGKSAPEGLGEGINKNQKMAIDATNKMGDEVNNAGRSKLEVNSPSHVFQRYGASVPEGLGLGVSENLKLATSAIEKMLNDVIGVPAKKLKDGSTFGNYGKMVVQNFSDGIKNNLTLALSAFDNLFNKLIAKTETFCNRFKNAVNQTLSGMTTSFNGVSVDAASGKIKYSQMPPIQIPRLATGAVIPPNREFLAVLGDQKHGRNIETPEGLLRKIYREESGNIAVLAKLNEIISIISKGGGDVVLQINGNTLGKATIEAINRLTKQSGKTLLIV